MFWEVLTIIISESTCMFQLIAYCKTVQSDGDCEMAIKSCAGPGTFFHCPDLYRIDAWKYVPMEHVMDDWWRHTYNGTLPLPIPTSCYIVQQTFQCKLYIIAFSSYFWRTCSLSISSILFLFCHYNYYYKTQYTPRASSYIPVHFMEWFDNRQI